jgi:murein DD-endopeptidase MepM/ murein hydrolase activator NlpD
MGKAFRLILLSVFCFVLIHQNIEAQVSIGNYICESRNDSMDLSQGFYDSYDSSSLYLPASEIYENWSNEYVHYPDIDFSKKEDTTILLLVDSKNSVFCMPRKGAINSEYGFRKRRFHYGIDIDLDIGDSVRCAFDGVVRMSRYNKGYGNVIVVRHYNGLETIYGHLAVSRVYENQPVKAGELLGYGGSTGRSTGPHLHFETRYLGTPFNPKKIIDFQKFCLISDTLLVSKYTFNNVPVKTLTATNQTASTNGTKTGTQTYSSGGSYYYVKKGDTLSHIAVMYNTSVDRLCQMNGISNKSVLQIGQKIKVK